MESTTENMQESEAHVFLRNFHQKSLEGKPFIIKYKGNLGEKILILGENALPSITQRQFDMLREVLNCAGMATISYDKKEEKQERKYDIGIKIIKISKSDKIIIATPDFVSADTEIKKINSLDGIERYLKTNGSTHHTIEYAFPGENNKNEIPHVIQMSIEKSFEGKYLTSSILYAKGKDIPVGYEYRIKIPKGSINPFQKIYAELKQLLNDGGIYIDDSEHTKTLYSGNTVRSFIAGLIKEDIAKEDIAKKSIIKENGDRYEIQRKNMHKIMLEYFTLIHEKLTKSNETTGHFMQRDLTQEYLKNNLIITRRTIINSKD